MFFAGCSACEWSNTDKTLLEIERARSLSPSKNSQPATSPSSLNPLCFGSSPDHAAQPPINLSPSPQPHTMEHASQSEGTKASAQEDPPRPLSPSPTKSSATPSTNTALFSRSSTLSWQQRPSSRDSNTPRSRPLSRHPDEVTSAGAGGVGEERTREQIAQSLSLKDPSWFRQTADRGASSSAYRKSREESQADLAQSSRQLPGMSRVSSIEPEKMPLSSYTIDRSRSPSQASSAPDTSSWGNRFSSMSSQSTMGGPKSPLPTKSSQRFGPPAESLDTDHPSSQRASTSSIQGHSSRERPSSPTKGLGGFVQSAMMKRSDSVNKRWSAQAAPGLSRGNSVASYRGGIGHLGPIIGGAGSPPRETNTSSRVPTSSPSAKSRPSSSHSTSTVLHHAESTTHSSLPPIFSDEPAPTYIFPSLSKDTPAYENSSKVPDPKPRSLVLKSPVLKSPSTLPISPTRTMDPKRWSPTKASWLESALARPESPKITSPKPQTPSWMADLQKSNLSKEDSEPVKGSASSFTVVSPTGLMRSPPPPGGHARPLSTGGLPEGFSSGLTGRMSPEKALESNVEENQSPQRSLSKEAVHLSISPTKPSSDHPASSGAKVVAKILETNEIPTPTPTPDSKSPPPSKPKPHTAPKTDFRANLRPRQNASEESSSMEPEFKNVFGKLKRTNTKNYVAPDELKDNILRGKAALSLTGGPQKTKRVDGFKESILKKKESMKPEAALPRKNVTQAAGTDIALQKSTSLPEALAKRITLNKRTNSSTASPADTEPELTLGNSRSVPPTAVARKVPPLDDRFPPSNEAARSPEAVSGSNTDLRNSQSDEQKPSNIVQPFANGKARATTTQEQADTPVPLGKPPSTASKMTKQSRENSNLAGRLNPNLASIISQGPTSATSSRNASSDDLSSTRNIGSRSTNQEKEESSSGPLTHMTKVRARGPKRRLPRAAAIPDDLDCLPCKSNQRPTVEETSQETYPQRALNDSVAQDPAYNSGKTRKPSFATRSLANVINNDERFMQPSAAKKKPMPPDSVHQLNHQTEVDRSSIAKFKEKTKPVVAGKSPILRNVSSPPPSTSVAIAANSDKKPVPSREEITGRAKTDSLNYQEGIGKTITGISQPIEVRQPKDSASTTFASKSAASLQRDLPDPKSHSEGNATPVSVRKPMLSGLGLKLESGRVQPPSTQLTPPPENKSTDALKPWKTAIHAQGKEASKIPDSATVQERGFPIADLLTDFFDEKPKITDKVEVDAQAMIQNRTNADSKSKVLKTQVWQIDADGRKESLPPQQEHILFEDCMYLCVHSFETSTRTAAIEVYFWSGDGVGEAAIEDAQLFCRREARENNAKLELLRQGKEPAKFFQALGGIVITRRSRTTSLYMLCGRRHLGHVAFDEVDLDATCLCSGFPYLISAKFGKLYLWKGKGSGADEVGCARLIGMDLGLTGEIEEVEEGEESPSFLESLGGAMKPQTSSEQWSLRARSNHYACRLFRVELEQSKGMSGFWTRRGSSPAKASKASVQEVNPFCQRDLDSRCILVLDAYFNIFV